MAVLPLVAQSQVNDPGSLGGALRQNIEQQLPLPNALPMPGATKPLEEKVEPKADVVKVVLKGFKFQGVTLVSEQELQAALAPWLGKSVTLEELQQLSEVIAEVYKKKGYLVQVTLPPQKIGEEGIVLFSVMEAKFGGVSVDADKDSRMSADTLKGFVLSENKIGEYVSIDSIERSIYIMKEIPGIAVATQIEPGQKDGEANLKIKLENAPLITGRVETNNYGSRSTGQMQGLGFMAVNNPFGFGDQITTYGLLTAGSQYGQVGYSLPVASTAWRLGMNLSMMNYNTVDIFRGSGGRSNTLGASLTYPLLRSQQGNMNFSLNYDQKSYLNMNTSLNSVSSSYVIRNVSSTLSGNRYDELWGGGVNNASATLTLGGINFNDDNPSNYGVYTPTRFRKINLNLSRNQQIVADKTMLNVSFAAQLADENLDSAERFYLGGPNGVRAFPVAQGGGAQGASMTVELQQQFPNRIMGSVFIDAGRIKQYMRPYDGWQGATHAPNEYNLFGAGVGAKWNYDRVTLSGSMAWRLDSNPLYTYSGENVNNDKRHSPGYSPYVWFQLQYAL
jgi:hemolysin activation/secretion protein